MLLVKDFKLLCPDHLAKGVHNTFATNSEVYKNIAWEQIHSLTYKYNVAEELPEVEYRVINGAYIEGTASLTQAVEDLVILGGDADVDVMLQYSSNLNDLRAIQTELKSKSVIRQFEKDFFIGDGTGNSFRGLEQRLFEGESGELISKKITGTQTTAVEELQAVYELMSRVKNPTHLFMSKTLHVKFIMMLHNAGIQITQTVDNFGKVAEYFNGCMIVPVEDHLVRAEKMYCVSFDKDNMRCVTSSGLQVRDLGELDTRPCYRTRIELSVALAVTQPKAFAILDGSAEVVTLEDFSVASKTRKK